MRQRLLEADHSSIVEGVGFVFVLGTAPTQSQCRRVKRASIAVSSKALKSHLAFVDATVVIPKRSSGVKDGRVFLSTCGFKVPPH